MDKEQFVARAKTARDKKGITIKELAERCGVSASAMNRYLSMAGVPTLDVAATMAQVLGVSLDWLCGLSNADGQEKKFTTGKIVRLLSELLANPTMVNGEKVYAANFDDDPRCAGMLYIEQSKIPSSIDFQSWSKFIDLYRNGTIDADMYNAWVEKKTSELDCVLLPRTVVEQAAYTAVPEDELPF